jgi:hypothetical protein
MTARTEFTRDPQWSWEPHAHAGRRNTEVREQAFPLYPSADTIRLRLAATVDQVTVRAMITPAQSRAARALTSERSLGVASVAFIQEDSGESGVKLTKPGLT